MHNAPAPSTWSLKYKARRDLRLQLISGDAETRLYNLLDPLTRQSYRIGDLEWTILQLLDGQRALGQVFSLLQNGSSHQGRKFPELTEARFLAVVEQFRHCGLVRAAGSFASAPSPFARAQSLLSSFVVWQLRGVQPDAWLAKLAPRTDALFSGAAVRFWILFAAITGCAVGLEFQRLAQHTSAWQWIIHPVQGTTLFIVFLFTRAAHELGHALVCKRYGVRCPDIGIFVILGAPCVYCDVSESWHLPSRWQRAAVAAAGMYVELIVASLAAWVWILTVDGPVNTIAVQTMFVCSISTLLINANPLMRFDGYYLLSDLLDDPNLRSRADQLAVTRIYRWILGRIAIPTASVRLTFQDHFLILFSWSSWIYRSGLSLAIASMLAAIYASWNLAWMGRLIAVSILVSWWGVPSMKFVSDIAKIARTTQTSWRLAVITVALVMGIVIVPLPYRQFARGWVQPVRMQGIYASVGGELKECRVNSGTVVEEGQPVFQLDNPHLERIALKRSAERERAEMQFAALKKESLWSPQIAERLSASETATINAVEVYEQAKGDLERLTLRATIPGRLMVLSASPNTGPGEQELTLIAHHWDDATQEKRYVAKDTLLATVCSPDQVAVLPLNDEQLEWVVAGTEVRLRCADRMDKVYSCQVNSVIPLREVSATWRLINTHLSGASDSGESDATAGKGAAKAAYAACVNLPEGVSSPVRVAVDATFVAPAQTLASIGYRWLQKNLRWLAD